MDAFMIVIAALSTASLLLILYNTLKSKMPTINIDLRSDSQDIEIVIEDRSLIPYVFKAEGLPNGSREPGSRILRIARDLGASITVVSSLYRVRKDAVLRKLEDAISRLEVAYAITRSAQAKARLEAASAILDAVSRHHQPYWGALALIVWAPRGPDGLAKAEAVRSLVEAELGIRLEPVRNYRLEHLLAPRPGPAPLEEGVPVIPPGKGALDGFPIIVGWRVAIEGDLVYLEFPRDFERHIAIIGPTGRGKTVLMAGLVSQLSFYAAAWGDLKVVVVDPKGDLTSLLSGLTNPKIEIVTGERDDSAYITAIKRVWQDVRMRRNSSKTIVAVDEAWRLMRVDPALFEAIAREGRSLGLHLVYAVQEPSDVPRPVIDNTGVVIVFGGSTRSYSLDAASLGIEGLDKEIGSLPVGEAILSTRSSRPVVVRVLNFEKLLKPARHRASAGAGRVSAGG